MPLRSSGGKPLADQVYSNLTRRIGEGNWQANDRLPSERALAEELGVCRVTVARAVNRLVQEGVVRRRRGSGTFIAARADTRPPSTGGVGLLIPFSRDGYTSHIVKGVASVLSDAGYHVLFHDTHADWRRESHQIQRLRGRVDGFLVFPADPMRNSDVYAEVLSEGTPLVFVDRYCPTLATDWVVTDNYHASLEAVSRLIQGGRRRIAHITTAETFCTSTQDRRLGYSQALLAAGLPVLPRDIRIATMALGAEAQGAARAYAPGVPNAPPLDVDAIVRALLSRDGGVDAIFSVNDWTTLASLHALRRAGVRVPEDVAVAGFADNDMVAEHLPVPIIAVHQPRDDMGRRAAEILLERLRGETGEPQQVFLPATVREVGGAWSRLLGERA
jgi:DNA-binding LacI/PurR family transcriptional regulator